MSLPVRHKLVIKVPGADRPQSTTHPDEFTARAHLRQRLEGIPGVPVGIPPLPAGTEWRLTALLEEEIAKGKVP